jgi:cell division protein FtsZ
MASGKRASMREGPLAALFRRTEEEGLDGPPPRPLDPPRAARVIEERREPGLRRVRPEVFANDIPEDILERPQERSPAGDPFSVPSSIGKPVIHVVGVGGAGVNALNRMVDAGVDGVEFIAVNTDLQSLQGSSADRVVDIGAGLTRGLGSGSDPEVGRRAAMEAYDGLKGLVKGSDMVFVAAGEGGGTGTGAAPVMARVAREVGALTVGIVTKPFGFEGSRRAAQADRGIEELSREVDTLIVIPNARLLTVLDRKTSMVDAFRVADDVLRQGVQGISDLITLPGLINLDFADVRTIMSGAGQALLGIGMATGESRAVEAAQHAIQSPLLETSVEGARAILLSITGGEDLSLWEVNEAARTVSEAAHPEANIIFGAMVDPRVSDQVWVTVVATGYGDKPRRRAPADGERRPARAESGARQADVEPRVSRPARPREERRPPRDFDVPEFVPRR